MVDIGHATLIYTATMTPCRHAEPVTETIMMENESLLSTLKIQRDSPLRMNYQIKEGIKELIASDKLSPGSQIPSVQKLAGICEVSFHTAKYAVRDPVREGVLEARSGIGTFVSARRPLTTEIIICDTQPFLRSRRLAFHRQIIDGLIEGYGDSIRRLLTVYTGGYALSSEEIVSSAKAKNADCIIAYRPTVDNAMSLRRTSYEICCISIGCVISDSMAHSLIINPEKPLRKMLEKRIRAGRCSFAYIGYTPSPDFRESANPYARIYEIFRDVMNESGIDPMVCWINEPTREKSEKLTDFEKRLSDDTTLVRLPYSAPSMAAENSEGLDIITYTECRQTLERWKRLGKSVLYGGLEKCGIEAARLHNALNDKEHVNSTVHMDVEPDVIYFWDGEGINNPLIGLSSGIEEIL